MSGVKGGPDKKERGRGNGKVGKWVGGDDWHSSPPGVWENRENKISWGGAWRNSDGAI